MVLWEFQNKSGINLDGGRLKRMMAEEARGGKVEAMRRPVQLGAQSSFGGGSTESLLCSHTAYWEAAPPSLAA